MSRAGGPGERVQKDSGRTEPRIHSPDRGGLHRSHAEPEGSQGPPNLAWSPRAAIEGSAWSDLGGQQEPADGRPPLPLKEVVEGDSRVSRGPREVPSCSQKSHQPGGEGPALMTPRMCSDRSCTRALRAVGATRPISAPSQTHSLPRCDVLKSPAQGLFCSAAPQFGAEPGLWRVSVP